MKLRHQIKIDSIQNMKGYLIYKENQTIKSLTDDKTLFFGLDDFMNKIVIGSCCFICGASPDSKPFNDEHIIPYWILKKFGITDRQITLPNGTFIKYGSYTVPCCQTCNTELGKNLEEPISNLLKRPYNEVVKELKKDDSLFQMIYRWLCLIYLKTHLKDMALLMERDRRKDAGKIGDYYDWGYMHHIHCMARQHHTGAVVSEHVFGTLMVLPALVPFEDESFDYMDNLAGQTIMIQIDEICIIAVLNDSNAGNAALETLMGKITGHLTPFQVREIFAHLTYININIKDRPRYYSEITSKGYEILAKVPERIDLYSGEEEKVNFAELLQFYVNKLIPDDNPSKENILQLIKGRKLSYLLNENGEFIQNKINNATDLS